jgi:hypothetical protein
VLEDKEVLLEIPKGLLVKLKVSFIRAQDICDIVTSKKFQMLLSWLRVYKPSILLLTAQRWLAKIKWYYRKTKNRIYSRLKKHCNIWIFQMDCNVALDSMKILLSTGRVK